MKVFLAFLSIILSILGTFLVNGFFDFGYIFTRGYIPNFFIGTLFFIIYTYKLKFNEKDFLIYFVIFSLFFSLANFYIDVINSIICSKGIYGREL